MADSIIQQLYQRKMFRITAAYLAAAWVLWQVVGTTCPAFECSRQFQQSIFWFLVAGLPITLAIAWVNWKTAILVGSGLLAGATVMFFVMRGPATETETAAITPPMEITQPVTESETEIQKKSIAVLPFVNMSADPDQEYFADGVTEDLIGALAGIKALRVPSHRSVLRFKGTKESLPQIAAELGVDALIEGRVRRVGDQVRITAQLVKSSDEHIWHQSYDEDLREILTLQARIARAVADRVQVTLTASETERLTIERSVVPAAYDAYVRARKLQRIQFGFAATEIVELLEQAVALDPDFVSAHVWLAYAYWSVAVYNFAPSKGQTPKARAHAEKALALGGVEANITLGNIAAYYDWDNAKATELYQSVRDARPHTAFSTDAWASPGYGPMRSG